jgi:aspartyl aminopeptidase
MRCVDVGIPQLSMHSLREMCGTADVLSAMNLLTAFYREFRQLDQKVIVGKE